MNTDDLITSLSANVAPVRRGAVGLRIVLGMAAGALVSLAFVLLRMGVRPDFGIAMTGFPVLDEVGVHDLIVGRRDLYDGAAGAARHKAVCAGSG